VRVNGNPVLRVTAVIASGFGEANGAALSGRNKKGAPRVAGPLREADRVNLGFQFLANNSSQADQPGSE
jgi:hypothetical protein